MAFTLKLLTICQLVTFILQCLAFMNSADIDFGTTSAVGYHDDTGDAAPHASDRCESAINRGGSLRP